MTSVWPSDRKVGDDLIEGKNSEFGCEITTERILSTYFIFWLVGTVMEKCKMMTLLE